MTKQEEGNQTIRQLNHTNVVRLARQLDARLRLGVRVNHAHTCVVHEDLNVTLLRLDFLDTVPNRVGIRQINKQILWMKETSDDNRNAIAPRLLLQCLASRLCVLQTPAPCKLVGYAITTNDHLRPSFEQNPSNHISEPAVSTLLIQ